MSRGPLHGQKFTTETGDVVTVSQDPSGWSDQYVDVWIEAPDGELTHSARPRSLVLARLAPTHPGRRPTVARSGPPEATFSQIAEVDTEAGEQVKVVKAKAPTTAEVAARFVLASLAADPALDRKRLGELAEASNPAGPDAMNGKAIVDAGKLGEAMPANKIGHYVSEAMTWLHDHRTDDEVAPHVESGALVETKRGSQKTFALREPEPEAEKPEDDGKDGDETPAS